MNTERPVPTAVAARSRRSALWHQGADRDHCPRRGGRHHCRPERVRPLLVHPARGRRGVLVISATRHVDRMDPARPRLGLRARHAVGRRNARTVRRREPGPVNAIVAVVSGPRLAAQPSSCSRCCQSSSRRGRLPGWPVGSGRPTRARRGAPLRRRRGGHADDHDEPLGIDLEHDRTPNPAAVLPGLPIWSVVTPGTVILPIAVLMVAAAVSVVVRHRRATGIERQQLRWFSAALAFVVLAVVGGYIVGTLIPAAGESGVVWLGASSWHSPACRSRSGSRSCATASMTSTGSSAGRSATPS